MESNARKTAARLAEPMPAQTAERFWRSLEELCGDDQFIVPLRREFPEFANRLNDGATRRQFLQLMSASLALAGVQGCVEQPQETIVPYVQAPEMIIPGQPLYYATAITHDGAGVGLLVESQMGRPVKIEGNPLHPAVPEIMATAPANDRVRFGATDAYSQAAVLSLYDPDRSQTVIRDGQIATWGAFLAEIRERRIQWQSDGGRGLRLLSETVVSPTLAEQLTQLLEAFPNAQWHQFDPLNRDHELLGSQLAFGTNVQANDRFEQADVVLSLDADFLTTGTMHLQSARGFANRRRINPNAIENHTAMNRLYVVESSVTLTGAAADHRLPVLPREVAAFAARLAKILGLPMSDFAGANRDEEFSRQWVGAVAADLQQARGRSLVLVGRSQPPWVHAIAHWINTTLENVGRTIEYREPIVARPEVQTDSLRRLVEAMRAGEVQTLVILGGNPVYNAPADFDFVGALANVPHRIHLSQYADETSARCRWHIPEAHFLESWSDTRAGDGTASIVQPLIAPLYDGKSAHQLLNVLTGDSPTDSYEIVRNYWQRRHEQSGQPAEFDKAWKTALHDGIVAGTQSPTITLAIRADFESILNEQLASPLPKGEEVTVVFRPDPSVWDGRFANNGWLQELPRPQTTLAWDNAALIAPATAGVLQLKSGDTVEVAIGQTRVQIPVLVTPGHAAAVVTLPLGYGRERAGRIGNRVGANVYPLRTSAAMWHVGNATLRATGGSQILAVTQHHHMMEGRDIIRAGTLKAFLEDPAHPRFMAAGHHTGASDISMYPPHIYDGYKWGMVVNQSVCIGCNACVVACQAENNIPIVGKDQVWRGREMHWLRIDNYHTGSPDNPTHYHQPMLCQHCELAPCEPVCPVAATTHSSEGLNEMTYNRCVGTRYCSNNCPYKVRRFNFLDYNAELRQDATLQLVSNPNVTVRSRGVMEKCTYCVQRINAARIQAEKNNRTIRDGDIVTACQAACPTEAIVFGNLNDVSSRVKQESVSPLNYAVLGELNTRPRTTYLAVVFNPNPTLAVTVDQALPDAT